VSQNIILLEILITEKGVEVLAKFIRESDVFRKVVIPEQAEVFEKKGGGGRAIGGARGKERRGRGDR
jgi:hypothetical protein